MKKHDQPLIGKKAAILVGDFFHVLEAFYPYFRLKETGMNIVFVSDKAGKVYFDYHGEPLISDMSISTALKQKFDLIYCPGGFAPMKLRANHDMLILAKNHFLSGKLFAAICHAASFLVTLNVLKGKKATCYYTLLDDLKNAGAEYVDDAPIVDGNLITARDPYDLPKFTDAIIKYLNKGKSAAASIPNTLNLEGKKIGIFVEERYQVHQVWYSYFRLIAEGVKVSIIGAQKDTKYKSRISQYEIISDLSVDQALTQQFDGLIVPGDWAADKMRTIPPVLKLIRNHLESNKPLISIAEGHSVLISAGISNGRQLAGLIEMKQEIENSGAKFIDLPVFVHDNLITCRDTNNLPELMRCLIDLLKRNKY
jgi:protease I